MLEKNHSHFILVSNTSEEFDNIYGGEIDFRNQLEKELSGVGSYDNEKSEIIFH